jgi:hypothetical protein
VRFFAFGGIFFDGLVAGAALAPHAAVALARRSSSTHQLVDDGSGSSCGDAREHAFSPEWRRSRRAGARAAAGSAPAGAAALYRRAAAHPRCSSLPLRHLL